MGFLRKNFTHVAKICSCLEQMLKRERAGFKTACKIQNNYNVFWPFCAPLYPSLPWFYWGLLKAKASSVLFKGHLHQSPRNGRPGNTFLYPCRNVLVGGNHPYPSSGLEDILISRIFLNAESSAQDMLQLVQIKIFLGNFCCHQTPGWTLKERIVCGHFCHSYCSKSELNPDLNTCVLPKKVSRGRKLQGPAMDPPNSLQRMA